MKPLSIQSSDPSLRQSPSLQELLSCSSTENLRRFMHSPGFLTPRIGTIPALDCQASPTAFLSSRPTTSISSFTARENLRLQQRLGTAAIGSIESPRVADFSPSSLPSELDYKRAIEKLNRIAAGGSTNHKIVLGERKVTGEMELEAEGWLYVKVETKGMPVPLRVNIKRKKGKIVTYVSKSVPEPSELQCEFISTSDIIIVRDNTVRFLGNYVFLGLFAVEEATFSLRTQFGKVKTVRKLLSRRCEDMEDSDLWALLPSPRPKESKFTRNFLQENRAKAGNSPWWSGSEDRKEQRESRQQAAKQRFRQQLGLKRGKAIAALNRAEARRREREEQARRLEESLERQECQQFWLKWASASLASERLWSLFEHKRSVIQVENLKHKFAEKIQKSFRSSLRGLEMREFLQLRAGQGLRLLVHSTALLDRPVVRRKIRTCLVLAGKNARVKTQFLQFWLKSKQ